MLSSKQINQRETMMEAATNQTNLTDLKDCKNCLYGRLNDCNDSTKINIEVQNNIIKNINYEVEGCLIIKCTVELISRELVNKDINTSKNITKSLIDYLKNKNNIIPIDSFAYLENIKIQENRIKCALLPLETIILIFKKFYNI